MWIIETRHSRTLQFQFSKNCLKPSTNDLQQFVRNIWALWRVTISWVTITFLKTIANQHISHRSDASLKTEIYKRSKSKMKKMVWSIRCLPRPQLGPRSFCSIKYYVFYKAQNAQPKMILGSQSLSNAPVVIPTLYDQGFLKNQHERDDECMSRDGWTRSIMKKWGHVCH